MGNTKMNLDLDHRVIEAYKNLNQAQEEVRSILKVVYPVGTHVYVEGFSSAYEVVAHDSFSELVKVSRLNAKALSSAFWVRGDLLRLCR